MVSVLTASGKPKFTVVLGELHNSHIVFHQPTNPRKITKHPLSNIDSTGVSFLEPRKLGKRLGLEVLFLMGFLVLCFASRNLGILKSLPDSDRQIPPFWLRILRFSFNQEPHDKTRSKSEGQKTSSTSLQKKYPGEKQRIPFGVHNFSEGIWKIFDNKKLASRWARSCCYS